MEANQTPLLDPVKLVNQLDAEAIRNRIDDLNHEREALLVLLRAALRKKQPSVKQVSGGPTDAA